MFILARAGPSRVSLPVLSRAIHTSLAVPKRQTPEERRLREAKDRPKPEDLVAASTKEEAMERAELMRKNNMPTRWNPKKKLTFAAMAGLKELHLQDPETWTPDKLSQTYGISYDAVKRVLRSNFQAKATASGPFVASATALKSKSAPVSASASGAASIDTAASTVDTQVQQAYLSKWDKAKAHGRTSSVARVQRSYDIKRRLEGESSTETFTTPQKKHAFGLRKKDE